MDGSRSVCVFCGSSPGARPEYVEAARTVGRALAKRGAGLVFGGGRVGLMGAVADAAMAAGGTVLGVIPEALSAREIAHQGVTELVIVPDMHARKALMAARSSAVLVLPGGIGTFEEFFEVLTWAALGLHAKPIGLLDVAGYFQPVHDLLDRARREGFLRPEHISALRLGDDPESLVEQLLDGPAPRGQPRWIGPQQS